MAWPCNAEALPVTPNALGWLDLRQNQLFHPLSTPPPSKLRLLVARTDK